MFPLTPYFPLTPNFYVAAENEKQKTNERYENLIGIWIKLNNYINIFSINGIHRLDFVHSALSKTIS